MTPRINPLRGLKEYLLSKKSVPYFIFAVFALLLVSGFFLPGYILTLDMVVTRNSFDISGLFYGLSSSYSIAPFIAFLKLFNIFFSVEFIQKLSFFFIFFISGISAYKLCPEEWRVGRYFAGFLYMLNPFVYVRFLAGHWLLLLAYAVTPFVIKGFMDYFKTPSMKNAVYVAFLLTFVFALETHTPFLLFIVFGFFFLAKLMDSRKSGEVLNLSKSTLLLGLFLLALSAYWLVPSFIGSSTPLGEISNADVTIFATKVFNFNTLFTAASMYGFWRGGYIYTKDLMPYWQIFFVIILFFAVHGFVSNYKHPKYGLHVRVFGTVTVLSVLMAGGISGPSGGVFEFLFNNVFFFKGFREPQKFVALLVLSYAYLGGLGVAEFEKLAWEKTKVRFTAKKIMVIAVLILALATPFVYSFTMFNGFWGQLKPTDYPKDWYEVNDFLNQDKQDFNVLFLPWHEYMDFKWLPNTEKRLANPASVFFDKPVIQGDNMETGAIYSSSTNSVSKYIEFLLSRKNKINNFGELVTPLNVKYIILTKEVDYKVYDFLYNQSDLEVVKDTENLVVFRNKHAVAKFYQIDNISTIKSWDDLLELSNSTDLTSSAFVMGDTIRITASQGQALDFTKKSPVKYKIEKPIRRYVVYTERYSKDWKLGGKMPEANFGVTNIYDTSDISGLTLYYERFDIYLAGYLISGISFVGLLIIYYRERQKQKAEETD
jgi:hypothetical protein